MGIADDMIDGLTCSHCGQYFADPNGPGTLYAHGYPVLCDECYDDCTEEERAGLQRAEVSILN